MAQGEATIPSKPITFAARWSKDDLNEIKQRAQASGTNTTEYIRRCALGLHMDDSTYEDRFSKLEHRLDLLEERKEAEMWG